MLERLIVPTRRVNFDRLNPCRPEDVSIFGLYHAFMELVSKFVCAFLIRNTATVGAKCSKKSLNSVIRVSNIWRWLAFSTP